MNRIEVRRVCADHTHVNKPRVSYRLFSSASNLVFSALRVSRCVTYTVNALTFKTSLALAAASRKASR
jgi:hypothetical protein